jgi:aspartyl-tRNA synthetase
MRRHPWTEDSVHRPGARYAAHRRLGFGIETRLVMLFTDQAYDQREVILFPQLRTR